MKNQSEDNMVFTNMQGFNQIFLFFYICSWDTACYFSLIK